MPDLLPRASLLANLLDEGLDSPATGARRSHAGHSAVGDDFFSHERRIRFPARLVRSTACPGPEAVRCPDGAIDVVTTDGANDVIVSSGKGDGRRTK